MSFTPTPINPTTETVKPSPFIAFTQRVIPATFDQSLSYQEALYALLNYINKLGETVNENAEVTDAQTKVIEEMTDYLNNYFDNLDVQNEINNKLDDMAENGELAEIISAYLNSNALITFNTISDLKAADNLIEGSSTRTLGYHNINDGGAAIYKIRTLTNEDDIDEGELIALTNYPTLVAEICNQNEIYPEQFGAKGDNETNDNETIANTINYAYKKNCTIKFNNNKTYVVDKINLPTPIAVDFNNATIKSSGDDAENSLIIIGNANDSFESKTTYVGKFNISNIRCDLNNTNRPYGVELHVRQQRINSIRLRNCQNSGIYIGDNDGVWIDNIHVQGNNTNTTSGGVVIDTNDVILGNVECAYFAYGVNIISNQNDISIDTLHVWSDVANSSVIKYSTTSFYGDFKSIIFDSTKYCIDISSVSGIGKINIGNIMIFPSTNFTNWRIFSVNYQEQTGGITIGNVFGLRDDDTANRFENFIGTLQSGLNYNQKPTLYVQFPNTSSNLNFTQNNGMWYHSGWSSFTGGGSINVNFGNPGGKTSLRWKNIIITAIIYNSNYNPIDYGTIYFDENGNARMRATTTLADGTPYLFHIATPLPAGFAY